MATKDMVKHRTRMHSLTTLEMEYDSARNNTTIEIEGNEVSLRQRVKPSPKPTATYVTTTNSSAIPTYVNARSSPVKIKPMTKPKVTTFGKKSLSVKPYNSQFGKPSYLNQSFDLSRSGDLNTPMKDKIARFAHVPIKPPNDYGQKSMLQKQFFPRT